MSENFSCDSKNMRLLVSASDCWYLEAFDERLVAHCRPQLRLVAFWVRYGHPEGLYGRQRPSNIVPLSILQYRFYHRVRAV